jgi:hypothetical protein
MSFLTAAAPAGERRSARRGEPRDQARAQRGRTMAVQWSAAVRREFQRLHPCPSTGKLTGGCPGYAVDHIIRLKRGCADAPSNMQWQTVAEAKAKDRIE